MWDRDLWACTNRWSGVDEKKDPSTIVSGKDKQVTPHVANIREPWLIGKSKASA